VRFHQESGITTVPGSLIIGLFELPPAHLCRENRQDLYPKVPPPAPPARIALPPPLPRHLEQTIGAGIKVITRAVITRRRGGVN
jgi:hypothetical protein